MKKILIILFLITSCVSSQGVVENISFDLIVSDATPPGEYSRKEWKHWIDADHDCQNTRQEVLIAESITPVTFKDEKHCTVISGEWHDPYTGEIVADPKKLDVDHMVPLAETWRSGGYSWSSEKKKQFANDISNPQHLIAVTARANRQKSDKDPANWLPPLESYRCKYVTDWVQIKKNHHLTVDTKEKLAIQAVLAHCN